MSRCWSKIGALLALLPVLSLAVPELHAGPAKMDTLSLWVMDQGINTGSSLQKLTRKFTLQTGVPVKIRFLDWGSAFDVLTHALSASAEEGAGPDVLQLGSSWVPYFAKQGLISPITDLIDRADTSRFYEESMKSAYVGRGNTLYSLPWFLDVRCFFVNEKAWLELGLHDGDIETFPKFFGVLRAVAEANVQNEAGNQVVPFEYGVKGDWTGYQQMAPILWNFGGDFVAEENGSYRSALVDSLTLVGLRHYFKFLRDVDVSPYNLHENSSGAADRFIRSEQLIIYGTSELIRKIEFDNASGGLMESPIAKDGLITVSAPKGPAGAFTFVGGSHLALAQNNALAKKDLAREFFLFMLRADNIDFYSRHSGFIPSDRSLIRIWMQDSRYSQLVNDLERAGRSCPNIPEWSEIETLVNAMVNKVGESLTRENSDINETIAGLVYDTHVNMNKVLGREDKMDRGLQIARIKKILMQPVEEELYMGKIGIEEKSNVSMRLVVVLALGLVAIVLLLVYIIRVRKR